MSIEKRLALALAGILLPWVAAQATQEKEDFHQTVEESIKTHMNDGDKGSPFRKALKEKIQERRNAKKKFPSEVTYGDPVIVNDENGIGWGKGDCEEKGRCETPGHVVRYSVKTELFYGGPDEVHDPEPGKPTSKWPDLKILKHVEDAEGNWVPVDPPEYEDHTAEYKAAIAAEAEKLGRVAWKDDDPEVGEYEFGQEPLQEEIVEEITFTFPKGQEDQAAAFVARLYAAVAAGDATVEKAILMGFTYSGPNIDYTVGSKKKACLFGACVVVYDIRAGFALDWALGLRLPAKSLLDGPATMVAGADHAFSSTISTEDVLGDWTASQYGDVGAAEEGGNEFVMRIEMFAGAKVEILGANVCPYCQYVEIDRDYGETFGTPFGPGASFPLPAMTIPVKDFNYGIVSLGVGLKVTPTLGSLAISAETNTGLTLEHSAGSARTFQVKGCIENESTSREQVVELDQYKYWFNYFTLALGAYLDLNVGGYGAWNPSFTFLTLDLSKTLGSAGLYLGDHVQCDFAFNCLPAPADQRVKLVSSVVDPSAPTTTLALAGTPGSNGWWISDVAGTLSASDNPPACGAGVAQTSWGLDGAPMAAGTSFLLADERIMTVAWRSTDRDGNVEATQAREVKIDKTPPTITGAPTTQPNVRDWYNSDVTIHFEATDATSGVASLTPDTVLSAEAAGQSLVGEAVDHAGLGSTFTVDGINLDKTAPLIAISAPAAQGYENTDTLTLAWAIADPLSGVLSHGATLDGFTATQAKSVPIEVGSTIELLELGGGSHELVVTATDNADNARSASVTFVIDVTIDGLIAAVQYTYEQGWLSKGASKSLAAKALEARRALSTGHEAPARAVLLAFNAELQALHGKGVKDPAFGILYADVWYVLQRYGLIGNT